MDDLFDGLGFLLKAFAFVVDVVLGFVDLLGWLWKGLVWLMGPAGAFLGLANLLVLPWWHTPGALAASALLWVICIFYWHLLRPTHR